MRLKRLLASVLAGAVIINATPVDVFASVKAGDSTGIAKEKEQIIVRMTELDSLLEDTGSGQYGLLYRLRVTLEYEMFTQFIAEYQGDYDFESADFYYDQCQGYVNTFNELYSSKSSSYRKLKLTTSSDNVASSIKTNIDKEVPAYIRSCCKALNKKYKQASTDSEKSKFYKTYGTYLMNLYKLILVYQNAPKTLNNLGINSVTDYQLTASTKKEIMDIAETYNDILAYGKLLATETSVSDSFEVDLSKEIVENFCNGKLNEECLLDFSENPEVSQAYLAILACSSVYTPFCSYVGSPEFSTALQDLISQEDEALVEDVLNLYNQSKSLCKPLYKRGVDESGNPYGVAELITLDEFIEDVQSGSVGSLCTIKGDFHYNTEAGAWIYSQYSYANDSNKTGVIQQSTVQGTDEDNTGSAGTSEATTEDPTTQSISKRESNIPFLSCTAYADEITSSSIGKTLKNVIFVGDDNVKALQDALLDQNDKIEENNVYFFSDSSSKKLNNEKSDLRKQIKEQLNKNKDEDFTVIICPTKKELKAAKKAKTPNTSGEEFAKLVNDISDSLGSNDNYNVILSSPLAVNGSAKLGKAGYDNAHVEDYMKGMESAKLSSKIHFCDVVTQHLDQNKKLKDFDLKTASGWKYTEDSMLDVACLWCETLEDLDVVDDSSDGEVAEAISSISDGLKELMEEAASVSFRDAIDDLSVALFSTDAISDESKMTSPVLLYGTKYSRAVDNMTTAILQNIISECVSIEKVENKGTRYLYVNPFGDIVTDDGLVIMPGVCNPILFNIEQASYNPYTVAFMNSYPSVLSRSYYFQITNSEDVGKYAFFANATEDTVTGCSVRMYQITDNKSVNKNTYKPVLSLNPVFSVESDSAEILQPEQFVFESVDKWKNSADALSMDFYEQRAIVLTESVTLDNKSVFPYVVTDDTDYKIALAIAKSMYNHLAYDEATGKYTNTGKLNDNYLIQNLILPECFGSNNTNGFAKDSLTEYENFVKNSNSRLTESVIQFSEPFLAKIMDVDGVIGIRSSYEDPILGTITRVLRENWELFGITVLLILVMIFIRRQQDLIRTIILLIFTGGAVYFMVFVAPVYLSILYNAAINNICENLSYEMVGIQAEINDATVENNLMIDSDGNYDSKSASITLYKAGTQQLSGFYASAGVTAAEVTGGNIRVQHPDSGTFFEGDSYKINLNTLFSTLQIVSDAKSVDGSYIHQIKAKKTVSNNVDYYTPFYNLVDNFITKLNTFAEVYQIPRSTMVYSDGKSKDNYLVYSYVHSLPFLTPGSYELVEQEDAAQFIKNYDDLLAENAQITDALQAAFGSNGDWLGCHTIFTQLTEDSKKTLWAQAMQQNGYYDKEWNPNEEKINDLIIYINRQTKKFVFNIEPQIGTLSDSTIIKLISLRALVAFTQEVSVFTNYLYPFSINYAEFTLEDVMSCIYTDSYLKYVSCDMNVAQYIAYEFGWVHLIVFDLVTLLTFLFISAINVLIPTLYVIMCVLIIMKLILFDNWQSTMKGYFKSALFIFAIFTIFDATLVGVTHFRGSSVGFYVLLGMTILVISVLITMLLAILHNFMDLGNGMYGSHMQMLTDKLHLTNAISNIVLNARTVSPRWRYPHRSPRSIIPQRRRYRKYDVNADVDDIYDGTESAVFSDLDPDASTAFSDLRPDVESVDSVSDLRDVDRGDVFSDLRE